MSDKPFTADASAPAGKTLPAAKPFVRSEMEAGRAIFAAEWDFAWASRSLDSLPKMQGIEIAFAGRSNVGKSSLINALTNRKALARTSHTPGRTQEIIFFQADSDLRIADMPGYGYAEAPKEKVQAWTELIRAYLRGRANLARVYILIDARHGIKAVDTEMLDLLGQAAVSHQIVLTKCDQLKPTELAACIAKLEAETAKRPALFPGILTTSSREGKGIAELRAAIARLLKERQ